MLWNVIEDCWSKEPPNRPTAETVSLRLGDTNSYHVRPEFAQLHTTLKQVQNRNVSLGGEHSSTALRDGEKYRNDSITRSVPIHWQGEPHQAEILLGLEVRQNS
jgi:hypothetical protein